MKKLMNFMFLSCRKATELIEKKLLMGLNSKESVQLMFHTSMCDACKKYSHQSKDLDTIIKNHVQNYNPELDDLQTITPEYKEKILNSLKH